MNVPVDVAIRVAQLSKMFKIYRKPADMFWELLRATPRHTPFWALRDVSFEVKRGQVVGLIGRNGAGKSTLLKILAGTLDKTSGVVEVSGRISSILELGTGFNGDYTGRENIYLGGLIVGLSRAEVRHRLEWIIEFSELRDFIDQPFKTYSTGMQARLTFSTAVCIEPDILIVDEALAVGDAKFQRKCFGKIAEFRQAGRTILLVSHDMNTISTFCDHAIFLEGGCIVDQGEPQRITKVYYQTLFCEDDTAVAVLPGVSTRAVPDATVVPACPVAFAGDDSPEAVGEPPAPVGQTLPSPADAREALRLAALRHLRLPQAFDQSNTQQMRMGNHKAEILDFGILDAHGARTTLLTSGAPYTFFLRAVFYDDVGERVVAGFLIRTVKGSDMYGTSTLMQNVPMPSQQRGDMLEVRLHVTMWLANGTYFLTVAVADPAAESDVQYDLHYDALEFTVGLQAGIFTTSVVDLHGKFEVKSLAAVSNR